MRKIIVANWKMHKTIQETIDFIEILRHLVKDIEVDVLLAVPFTAIAHASKLVEGTNIVIGAQNVDFHAEGPYTGEISASMLKEAGARFVIVGHSERRRLFYETSEMINLKIKAALAYSLRPLLCIGETNEEKQARQVEKALKLQIHLSLMGLSDTQMEEMMIAYEPIWAVGANLTPSNEELFDVHRLCRRLIEDTWNEKVAKRLPILYGGSVNVENAPALLSIPGVDGLLVGGASLSIDSFSKIICSQSTFKDQT